MDEGTVIGRRSRVGLGVALVVFGPLGCSLETTGPDENEGEGEGGGRLAAEWVAPTASLPPGRHALGLGTGRDGYLYVPAGYDPTVAAPLALLLHGAGQNAAEWVPGFPIFDDLGLLVLAVDSRAVSWDIRFGGFGPDARFIERALAWTFERARVDPERIAVGGFSDGASYALSLGLTNGDFFTQVLGFSPGFVVTDGRRGTPPVFLSHGSQDPILPVGFTRQIAATLEDEGHEVVYEEFEGGHTLPFAVGERALRWFVTGQWGPALP